MNDSIGTTREDRKSSTLDCTQVSHATGIVHAELGLTPTTNVNMFLTSFGYHIRQALAGKKLEMRDATEVGIRYNNGKPPRKGLFVLVEAK